MLPYNFRLIEQVSDIERVIEEKIPEKVRKNKNSKHEGIHEWLDSEGNWNPCYCNHSIDYKKCDFYGKVKSTIEEIGEVSFRKIIDDKNFPE